MAIRSGYYRDFSDWMALRFPLPGRLQPWYANDMPNDIRDVDPRNLRLPSSRLEGADPLKLQRQIAQYGSSIFGMPPLWVYEAADGVLVVYNGVTRATRIAKLAPSTLVPIEVIGKLRRDYAMSPTIGDRLS